MPQRQPATEAAYALWRERTVGLLSAQDWSFNGRAAVSGSDIPSRTLTIHWTQHHDEYAIAFLSAFGQRVAELEGNASGVTLRVPDEAPKHAASAEELLNATFGWSAPVEGLRYWVRGLPQPFTAEPSDVSLDDHGRLLGLDQDGWHLDIAQYTTADGLDMPKKLTLSHPKAQVRLVIDEWTLDRAATPTGE